MDVTVPQLGESIVEAVVGKWNKQEGDSVAADEPVVVLETDKVTIDVQAPSAGAISKILYHTGAKVKIGDVLATIAEGAAGKAAPAAAKPAAAAAPAAAAPAATQAAASDRPSPTPVARAVAADRGIDPKSVAGSGSNGRVMKDDVLKAGGNGAGQAQSSAPSNPLKAPSGSRGEERVPMTTLRKRVAERLLQAQNNAAILTTFNEVDMGAVMSLRKQYNERFEKKHGIKLGFMSFFVKAAIEALKAFPAVNAFIDGEDVVFHHYYDIGVAVSGSRGLVVPIVRDADRLSMAELEKVIGELGVKARNDKLQLSDLQGGTFSITNGGIFGSMLSTPILNPPQTGILGMHNIVERPVAKDGQVVIRPIMYLALSYDHRLIDGREAVQFLVRIKDCIESPERMLLEV
ncbi:MAG: 2-oxoglutarate dehydrogenase complex dihydrolipoyllysine-residue succinyltransferase [Archangiaceae bacterium]|nr:2-oxoglutarate dehydrogenase complex dihydrolipoyllysine-residue succinyltransferase [Archangiaceae bacterium]